MTDTIKYELIDTIQRTWSLNTAGVISRKLSNGKRYHIVDEDFLDNERAVSARRAAKAERDRLLSDEAIGVIVRCYIQAGKRGVTDLEEAIREALAAALESKT